MIKIISNFFLMLKNPKAFYTEKLEKLSFFLFFKYYLGLLLFTGLGYVIMGILLFMLNPIARGLPPEFMKFAYLRPSFDYSILEVFLIGGLIAPVIEEMMFRGLLKFTKTGIALSLGVIFWVFMPGEHLRLNLNFINTKWFIAFFGGIIVFLIFYGITNFYRNFSKKAYFKAYNFIFYFFCFSFGLLHVFNHDGVTWYLLIISPIFTLPQTFGAFFYSMVRVRHGLKASILLHIFYNLIISVIGLFF